MSEIGFTSMVQQYWQIGVVAIFLVGLSIDFLIRFGIRSIGLGKELASAISALKEISSSNGGSIIELDEVGSKAMKAHTLGHLWSEYSKTLHPQREEDAHGQMRVARWRATTLAESFFSEQAIVDSRLKTEFFKHLPGVLTGLGIIGTFAGLIKGLVNFNVAVDPAKAQEQLQGLVNSVGHAFYVSASAIGLAMIFTWIEKSVVTARYRQIEELRELIDSLFKSGAGEEYLERLAVASETAATQAMHIKEALVADLKEILTTLATSVFISSAHRFAASTLPPPSSALSERGPRRLNAAPGSSRPKSILKRHTAKLKFCWPFASTLKTASAKYQSGASTPLISTLSHPTLTGRRCSAMMPNE